MLFYFSTLFCNRNCLSVTEETVGQIEAFGLKQDTWVIQVLLLRCLKQTCSLNCRPRSVQKHRCGRLASTAISFSASDGPAWRTQLARFAVLDAIARLQGRLQHIV